MLNQIDYLENFLNWTSQIKWINPQKNTTWKTDSIINTKSE